MPTDARKLPSCICCPPLSESGTSFNFLPVTSKMLRSTEAG